MSRTVAAGKLALRDYEPERAQFRDDALAGLCEPPKTLPCKYFYDETGSRLFDEICELDEYYPTRTELSIMRDHAAAMGGTLGPNVLLIEYGSGSSLKTRLLLDHLDAPAGYVPVDISREHLRKSAEALAADFPGLEVMPVCADFTAHFELPESTNPTARGVVYFPGSTIGNFTASRAEALLRDVAELVGVGGALLIGVDLRKDPADLERAYDDAKGVTAAFNRNLLVRMNRELDADFELDRFSHRAVWQEAAGRIEMHLVSDVAQTVRVDGEPIRFEAGEAICTEHSHKYTVEGFAELARGAGLECRQVWTDDARRFSVQYLEATSCPSTSPTDPT